MIDLGIVRPGSTLNIPFGSFAASTGAPSAVTNYADADIQVYKGTLGASSTTQRASAAGLTAATTFDSLTGINWLTINLADNTTAGFWAAGSDYVVVVSDITVDSQTLRFPVARFTIGHHAAILNTTIATLSSQTSFTLTNGSADNNAYVGCVVYVHDVASAVQCCMGVVSAYTGSTKTVTLAADPGIFTMAATDNICILPRANVHAFGGTAVTGRDIGASVLLSSGTGTGQVTLTSGRVNADLTHIATAAVSTSTAQLGVNVVNAAGTAWGSGAITAGAIASNAITSAKIATDAIGAAQLAADAVAEIQSGLATAAALATVDGIVDDIVADTNELQTDWANGGRLDNILDARASQASVDTIDGIVDAILVDTAEIGAAGAGLTEAGGTGDHLTALPWNAAWDAEVQSEVQDAIEANHLDHLLAVTYDPASKPGAADALLNELVENDGGVARYTANALEQAPSGSGPTAADIADAVWEEAIADHSGTSGSTAEALAAAGAAGDPWITALPGSYTSGQAGYIIGTNLNATVSSRATQSSVDTIDGIVDDILTDTGTTLQAELDGIQADTEDIQSRLPAALVSGRMDASVGAMAANTLTASALASDAVAEIQSGLSTLDAASVRTAVGLASANLDTQLGALSTAIATVDGIVDSILLDTTEIGAAGAGLTSLPWNAAWDAEVQSEVADALAAYDPPTNAEMEARTLAAASYATASALATVDTVVDAILDDTGTSGVVVSGASVRSAVGLAAANLDTQLGDLPTNAELATALAAADDAVLAAIAALNNLSAAQVSTEIADALGTDSYGEPTGVPAASAPLATKLSWLYMALRNRVDVTATEKTFYDDGGSAEWKKALSDDATTYTEAEAAAP